MNWSYGQPKHIGNDMWDVTMERRDENAYGTRLRFFSPFQLDPIQAILQVVCPVLQPGCRVYP